MKKGLVLSVLVTVLLLAPPLVFSEVYWGDLHVHTYYSKDAELHGLASTETPDMACSYAKTNSLNFVAITDHSENDALGGKMTQTLWESTKTQIQTGNCAETSTFIPFIGYEWTNTTYGHKSVIFKDIEIPWSSVFNSQSYTIPPALWTALDSAGYQSSAVTLPHHPAGGPTRTNWDYQHPAYQPLVEIYSEHGNSEYEDSYESITSNPNYYTHSVNYALGTKKFRMGLIAGTDAHDAKAGSVNDGDTITNSTYNGGLIAVHAPSLTRENIWYAIKNRHTYATSGPKIILDFKVNGYGIGATALLDSGETPTLHIFAVGSGANITKLEVIKNGNGANPSHTVTFNQGSIAHDWTDSSYISGDFYYVRIIQGDNERAWSSPIWVVTQ